MQNLFPNILQDESGVSVTLFAVALPPFMAMAALTVDLGSLYLAERNLQNVADAAAVAAVTARDDGAAAAVDQAITDSGEDGIATYYFSGGEYVRDPSLRYDQRFDPGSLNTNAYRVVLEQEVPLFFGSLLTDSTTTTVVAEATATRVDMAGFRLGSRVASIPGNIGNELLSALAGTALELTPEELDLLASTDIDVLDLASALGPAAELEGASFGEIMDANISLFQIVEAIGNASDDPAFAALMDRVAAELGGDGIVMSNLIDLGPLANTNINDGASGVQVDSYTLLRSVLQAAHGDQYDVAFDLPDTGLANLSVRLAGGYSEERSPWLTVDSAGDVILRTAETRLLLETSTSVGGALNTSINVPVYAELAAAEAQMTDIVCSGGSDDGVYIDTTPSIGSASIASVDENNFGNFTVPMWPEQATLINTPLAKVRGFASLGLGGATVETLHFTPEEVEQLVTKSVGTSDLFDTATTSLAEDVELEVETLGLVFSPNVFTQAAGNFLNTAAPALDGVLNSLTGLLGVELGVADVTVDRLRCGQPTLVG